MFVYTSPRTGNSAVVESILPGKQEINKECKIQWAGGGTWYATKEQLRGHLVNEDDLTDVPQAQFEEALRYIFAGGPVTNEVIGGSDEEEETINVTEEEEA